MQKKVHPIILVIAFTFFSLSHNLASSPQTFIHTESVETSAFPEVSMQLSAWDASGLPLEGLLPEHFTLREDEGEPFHPDSLIVDDQAPVRVVLAVDVSESMLGEPLDDAKGAAARFLDRLTPGQDQVAVIGFSGELDSSEFDPEREIGFTSELRLVYDLIEGLQAGGTTHLYDAASKAISQFEDLPSGHQAVLLLSDGRNDPPEAGDPQKAIALAQVLNVPFFVIGLGDQVDQPYLQRLAYETGGLFLPVPRSADLADMFSNIAALLKTRYTLAYTSTLPADGKPHRLDLSLNLDESETSAVVPLKVPFIPTQVPVEPTLSAHTGAADRSPHRTAAITDPYSDAGNRRNCFMRHGFQFYKLFSHQRLDLRALYHPACRSRSTLPALPTQAHHS